MSNDPQYVAINGMEVFADIDRFQNAMRAEMAGLPPSPAKEMMECAFAALGPLIAGLTRDYPPMLSAFRNQRQTIDVKIQQAKQNIAKAKNNLEKLPGVDQIQKNITPIAPTLPSGLAIQFADEMTLRYLPKPIPEDNVPHEAAAWQDWSFTK